MILNRNDGSKRSWLPICRKVGGRKGLLSYKSIPMSGKITFTWSLTRSTLIKEESPVNIPDTDHADEFPIFDDRDTAEMFQSHVGGGF